MHSCITPDVSTPCSTACLRPPARQMVLIARMWCRWPPSIALPRFEIDAERGAEERLLDVVDRERVAGEQDVDVAARESDPEVGCRRPCARRRGRPRPRCGRRPAFVSRIIAAMRETPTSTRRSDEISFVMNAKPSRSRSWNSGTTLTPSTPQTTASPARTSRSFRQTRAGRLRSTIDGDPSAARST